MTEIDFLYDLKGYTQSMNVNLAWSDDEMNFLALQVLCFARRFDMNQGRQTYNLWLTDFC